MVFRTCHHKKRHIRACLFGDTEQIVDEALKNKQLTLYADIEHPFGMLAAESRPLPACQQHRTDLAGTDRFQTGSGKARTVPVDLRECCGIERRKFAALFVRTLRIQHGKIERINLPEHGKLLISAELLQMCSDMCLSERGKPVADPPLHCSDSFTVFCHSILLVSLFQPSAPLGRRRKR